MKANAHRLTTRLSDFSDAQVMEVMTNGKKLYRVMMGPFHDRSRMQKIC